MLMPEKTCMISIMHILQSLAHTTELECHVSLELNKTVNLQKYHRFSCNIGHDINEI